MVSLGGVRPAIPPLQISVAASVASAPVCASLECVLAAEALLVTLECDS
jgi:hypothetical protein